MPFCLLFARNALASEDHRFYYASPHYEPLQNRHARFRIDYAAAQPVSIERVERQPWVLKALSLGTWRDIQAVEGLLAAFPRTLGAMWEFWNPNRAGTTRIDDWCQYLRPR